MASWEGWRAGECPKKKKIDCVVVSGWISGCLVDRRCSTNKPAQTCPTKKPVQDINVCWAMQQQDRKQQMVQWQILQRVTFAVGFVVPGEAGNNRLLSTKVKIKRAKQTRQMAFLRPRGRGVWMGWDGTGWGEGDRRSREQECRRPAGSRPAGCKGSRLGGQTRETRGWQTEWVEQRPRDEGQAVVVCGIALQTRWAGPWLRSARDH